MKILILTTCVYALALAAAVYFTRAGMRRMAGALAGGLAVVLSLPFVLMIAEAQNWWTCPFLKNPNTWPLVFAGGIVSYAWVALVDWRIERRFGWRGTAVFLAAVSIIGPPRDYAFAARYPDLMIFGPGFSPIAGNAAAYLFTMVLMLLVMRLISGPATADRLARSHNIAGIANTAGHAN
jgi:hypothetical protein